MINIAKVKSKIRWAIVFAPLMAAICLTGCLSGGGGGSDVASTTAPVVPPPVVPPPVVPPPVVPNPITAFSNAGGGNVTVTSANTLAPGAFVVISGTTNYNGTFTVVSANATTFTITAVFVANDATGAWVAGGGVIAGCTTTGAGITLPAMTTVASRFTGVAPLSVFFDASATTGAVTQPFLELSYTWSFGDPAGGATWAYGTGYNNSKNTASGPIAAHVFETPGTYTVTLTVTDGTNTVTNACMQIAVQDPNIVYANTATRCISKTGSFAGCPAGAAQITAPAGDFRAVIAAELATGRRLLFNRGETWLTPNQAVMNVNGPWTVGAYGAGAKPVVQWVAGQTILGFAANGSNSHKDARVMDLVLDPGPVEQVPFPQNAVHFYGKFDQVTLLRLDMPGGVVQDLGKAGLTGAWDEFTIADSTMSPLSAAPGTLGAYGAFISASRFAYLGNFIDNNLVFGEHNLRVMYTDKMVISNSTFTRPVINKANLTLRGPEWYTGIGPIPTFTYARYAVISDNKFIGGTTSTLPVNTSVDSGNEARTRYFIFERNWFTDLVGATTALALNSSFSTIRNNIIDLSARTGGGGNCITVSNAGDTQIPTDNSIYNNTCYANQLAAAQVNGVRVFSGAINTMIKNTLLYAPSATIAISVDNFLGVGTIGAPGTFGNSSIAQGKINPNFLSATPTVPPDFKITGGSYALGTGVAVPVWSDFFRVANSAPWDAGAVRH